MHNVNLRQRASSLAELTEGVIYVFTVKCI